MTNERYYKTVGIELEKFLIRKHQTKKNAALMLDISQSRLSKLISGERPPNRELMQKIVRSGFDPIYFDVYDNIADINADSLTKNELIQLYTNMQFLIIEQRNLIRLLTRRYKNIKEDYEY
jgi:predicted transcriptional regulator